MKITALLQEYAHQYSPETVFVGAPALDTKRDHICNVVNLVKRLYETSPNKDNYCYELLIVCAAMHDIGRLKQFELLGKFWDTEVSHNVLGVDHLDSWLAKIKAKTAPGSYYLNDQLDSTEVQKQIDILRNVILYHGRPELCFTDYARPYVEMITAADDLENAAACVSYLVREVKEDAKGYVQQNPTADQREVSDFVFTCFERGEKFDKNVHCHTYGEYVLFAATLMTSSCRKHLFASHLLKEPGYGYSSILAGYADVFSQTLTPVIADRANQILVEYSEGK